MGLYQLFWLDRVPNHALVFETVELAKKFDMSRQAGYVNAILRACIRERKTIGNQLSNFKRTDPHLGYSHPFWLVRQWQERWGESATRQLLEWNNTIPPTFARLNTLKIRAEELEALWREEGVQFEKAEFDWTRELCYQIQIPSSLESLGSFSRGGFYIQDPSTYLAVHLLDPQPGERIADLCAAPGGKTTLIAQFMQNQGTVHAHDQDFARLLMIEDNCQRLGISIVETARYDTVRDADLSVKCDGVLVDAPCGNTGVLRRRVDLRWRVRPEEIKRLAENQLEILTDAAKRVKPEGRLVYSTCSLEPEENERVIQSFLKKHPDFEVKTSRLLTPFKDKVDGAYAALMTRKKECAPVV